MAAVLDQSSIIQQAKALGPWHFDFEILPGVRTAQLNDKDSADPDKRGVFTLDPYHLLPFFKKYYPDGLQGKDVLDVGCNSGGYCFVAAELGARSALGFDVRQHWLDQAEFIRSHKYAQYPGVRFVRADAKQFLNDVEQVDIVIFKGMLYHLPDPVHILLQLAEIAREVILVDTASSETIPEGCWVPVHETKTHLMSGVDGLAWLPGGPAAVRPLLEYAGFGQCEVSSWLHNHPGNGRGRFQIIGTRSEMNVSGGETDMSKTIGRSTPVINDGVERISLIKSERLRGEPARLFDERLNEGFWDKFIRPGVVIDIGYKGGEASTPLFRDSVGIDLDTPGYDGKNLPYDDGSVGTVHASHLLEHIADYQYFFRECFRALAFDGTLIIIVPLMEAYERRKVAPSIFNPDHKRFYTAARLLYEIETSLPRTAYRVAHLRERIRTTDFSLPEHQHALGPYEIECVLEKIRPDGLY